MKNFFIFLLIAIILVMMRLPFVDEPFERDEGGYAYMAQRFLEGEVMYRDYWDNKPPGIVFIYALIFKLYQGSLPAVRIFSIFCGLIALLLVYLIAERIYDRKIAFLSALFYAIFSGGPLIQGSSANAEPFMMIFSMLGIYLFVLSERSTCHSERSPVGNLRFPTGRSEESRANMSRLLRPPHFVRGPRNDGYFVLLAGICFGIAFMIKPLAVGGLLTVFVCIILNRKQFIKRTAFVLLGFFIVWAPALVYFVQKEVLREFFYAVYIFNLFYVKAAYDYGWMFRFRETFLSIIRENSLLWFLGISALFMSKKNTLVRIWFLFSILLVLLGGRFYPHYFIQVIPALSVLSGYGLYAIFRGIRKREFWKNNVNVFAAVTVVLLVFLIVLNQYKYYFVYTPYEVCREKYETDFVFAEILGKEIGKETTPEDYVYVWGDEPEIYFYSKRKCPTRFIFNHLIRSSSSLEGRARQEMLQDLVLKKPKIIVAWEPLGVFPELEEFVSKNYEPRELAGVIVFYER